MTLWVDGEPIEAGEGATIAAAIIAAGGPPTVYCGIGVCQQCLVAVDGRGVVRSCVTAAEPGIRVTRIAPARTTPAAPAARRP